MHENVIGSRHAPTSAALSMHLFGMAIDVNYTTNPFISATANPVFERANKKLGRCVKTFRYGMTYDEIAELDKLLEDYFALLKDETLDAAAKKTIQDDLTLVTNKWERKKPAQKAAIEGGRAARPRQAAGRGDRPELGASYGDVMHFDMRNRGNGARSTRRSSATRQRRRGEGAEALRQGAPPQRRTG